jgi:hypothetical protein
VDNILLLSIILLAGICLILVVMNLYTYGITKNTKVLIISGIFILFFIQALLVLTAEFIDQLEFITEPRSLMMIDVLVVLIIYAATVKSS